MRFVQHKKEAYWFYKFLSVFYDKLVNPLFWTAWMRDQSLKLGKLESSDIQVIDVGSGTGFTTEGIVKYVPATAITCIDQSPHQMAKAKEKASLKGCTFILGDAEKLPVETDKFDRYVSAGSIEYWPNPQQGINESYRVIKPGGIALMIGPLLPKTGFARLMAETWMLFPTLEQYQSWYRNAGFVDIEFIYIRPHWYKDRDGYGVAIRGTKPNPGTSPHPSVKDERAEDEQVEDKPMTIWRSLKMIARLVVGSTAGFVFIPIALLGYFFNMLKSQDDRPPEYRESLNGYQILALIIIFSIIAWLLSRLF